jgi:DnaJ-class molecular chaperone
MEVEDKETCRLCHGSGGEANGPYSARPFTECYLCKGKGYTVTLRFIKPLPPMISKWNQSRQMFRVPGAGK